MLKISSIDIYTDGSSLGNPGSGGFAAIIKGRHRIIELTGGEPHTTNNRMEMRAIIAGLEFVKIKLKGNFTINLYSDSELIVKTLNYNWKRKKNLDLWQKIDELRKNMKINFQWLKGHNNDKYNERCDYLARKSARKQRLH